MVQSIDSRRQSIVLCYQYFAMCPGKLLIRCRLRPYVSLAFLIFYGQDIKNKDFGLWGRGVSRGQQETGDLLSRVPPFKRSLSGSFSVVRTRNPTQGQTTVLNGAPTSFLSTVDRREQFIEPAFRRTVRTLSSARTRWQRGRCARCRCAASCRAACHRAELRWTARMAGIR